LLEPVEPRGRREARGLTEKALVTGGAGFIGLHVARHLVKQGVEVTLVDDLSRGRQDSATSELLGRARFIEHDLTTSIPPEIADERFAKVFHFAGIVGVRRVSEAPEDVLRTNFLAALNVLEFCAARPPDTFFFSSTSEVGDGARELLGEPSLIDEDAPVVISAPMLPRAAYAVSKLSGELLVAHHARRNGFRARIGRYYNVYGPRMGYDHVIPQLMQRAHSQVDPYPVWAVEQSRAFCYIDDAVSATLALMELEDPQILTVNVGNDTEPVKIGELARLVLSIADYNPEIEPRPAPEGSPTRRRPDLRRIKALLEWRPRVSLSEGLAHTWAWYRADLDRMQQTA
jgi:nucleoside-diphosphate-sugar epimerase